MNVVFADTSYYLALVHPGDVRHATAVKLGQTLRERIVTTDFVVMELGNALSRASLRSTFVSVIDALRSDPGTEIVPATRDLLERGYSLFRRRQDKDWSLTDCISFEVMSEYGIIGALTADHHFEQAGFAALMR